MIVTLGVCVLMVAISASTASAVENNGHEVGEAANEIVYGTSPQEREQITEELADSFELVFTDVVKEVRPGVWEVDYAAASSSVSSRSTLK